MTARIYTGAEAEALRKEATPGPWRTYGNAAHDAAPSDAWTIEHDGDTLAELHADDRPQYGDASDEEVAEAVEADADLMAAAPDLAASVVHHARRAEKAEAARDTANADFVAAADGREYLARQVDHLEAEVARLTVALTAQTARADGAEATELRLTKERDDAIAAANDIDRMMSIVLGTVLDGSETTPNCNEFRGTYKGREFAMVVQWADGKSPHELIAKARKERDALRAAVREYLAARDAWEEWQEGGREGGPSAGARVNFARASAALRALLPEVTP